MTDEPEPPERLSRKPNARWRYCKSCEEWRVFVHGGITPGERHNYWECEETGCTQRHVPGEYGPVGY